MTAATTALAERIRDQALNLPAEDRARLLRDILESLGIPSAVGKDAVMADWGEEIRRRLAEYKAGEVETIDADECIKSMRAR